MDSMKQQDRTEEAKEQGAAWGMNAVQACGLTRNAVLTGEDALEALRQVVLQLLDTVADLSRQCGEEFAGAFEGAARLEVCRLMPRYEQHLQ